MRMRLNFSPRPFRERNRNLVLLWLINLALIAALAVSAQYWRGLRQTNASAHAAIAGIQAEQREVSEQYRQGLDVLDELDTRAYLKQVNQFHGIQNAFQTHWGKLLDDLGDILPDDVRILRLKPAGSADARRNTSEDATVLELEGEARYKDAQLAFIEALHEREAFGDVRFRSESYDIDGVAVRFELLLTYQASAGGQ